MDPVTGWTIAKSATEVANKLYEIAKGLKDRETRQQVAGIVGKIRDLKRQASELEEQKREPREKPRFKGDWFEFTAPFWYEKTHPDRALCPTCFVDTKAVPMADPDEAASRSLNC